MRFLNAVLLLITCNFKGIMLHNTINFNEHMKHDNNSNKAKKSVNVLQVEHDVDNPVISFAPCSKANDDRALQKNGIIHRIRNKQPIYNGKFDDLKSVNELEIKLRNSGPDLIDNVLSTQEFISNLKKSVAKNFSKYKNSFDIDTIINNNRNKFIFKRHAPPPPSGKSQKDKRKQHKVHVNSSFVKKQSCSKPTVDRDENKCSDCSLLPSRPSKKKDCETTPESTTTCKTTTECTITPTSETTTVSTTEATCESSTECSTETAGCDPGFLEPRPSKKRKFGKTTPACETEESDIDEDTTDCLAPTAPKCKTSEQCDDAEDNVDDQALQKDNENKK